ncbi:hypothetical protein SKAU_G00004130 [Synaphobranchus kaupii]|uniref:Uncharacterized protein n=1 Tax=Synaphobranchus kaupii TaxID=118154 RepID=A0A9Q1JCB4_SYNKA|nr:hypothetical protein SKAU_G00004130 [Synaphobranchus kaupii]
MYQVDRRGSDSTCRLCEIERGMANRPIRITSAESRRNAWRVTSPIKSLISEGPETRDSAAQLATGDTGSPSERQALRNLAKTAPRAASHSPFDLEAPV